MGRYRKVIVAALAVLVLAMAVLQVWLWKSPLVVMGSDEPKGELFDPQTAAGKAFMSLQQCAEQQKHLYECITAYRDKNGRLPADMNELINDIHEAKSFRSCPAGLSEYVVHFENYANPKTVLIEEKQNKHPTAFALWIRGYKPHVQTLGDGTIHLFADGKLATIQAKEND
ncbi:MAG: hypothetical protein GXY19_12495 [Phycisphaerae bacterium]|nr:hypothetical protein [Phycisphaerae bacterium]